LLWIIFWLIHLRWLLSWLLFITTISLSSAALSLKDNLYVACRYYMTVGTMLQFFGRFLKMLEKISQKCLHGFMNYRMVELKSGRHGFNVRDILDLPSPMTSVGIKNDLDSPPIYDYSTPHGGSYLGPNWTAIQPSSDSPSHHSKLNPTIITITFDLMLPLILNSIISLWWRASLPRAYGRVVIIGCPFIRKKTRAQ